MFAVIRTGGKQYKVAKDDVIVVEKLPDAVGSEIRLTDVLMVADKVATIVGSPLVAGAAVSAEVVQQRRAAKVIVFKKKRRKNYRRTAGHRQHETVLRITDILKAGSKGKAAAKVKPEPEAKKAETKKAAAKKAGDKKTQAKTAETKKAAKPAAARRKPAAKPTKE